MVRVIGINIVINLLACKHTTNELAETGSS